MITTDKKETILRSRSEKLAQIAQKEETLSGTVDIVLFSLSGETFGLESSFVDEVYPIRELTPLPGVPSFVKGLIQVRRKVYSLIDLRELFGITNGEVESTLKMIILKNAKMTFGILTNEVLGIRSILPDELQPALPSMQGVNLEFIKGITQDRIVILDGDKLLNASTLVVSSKGQS